MLAADKLKKGMVLLDLVRRHRVLLTLTCTLCLPAAAPKLYTALSSETTLRPEASAVLSTLKSVVSQSKATHLLLITKDRDEARFQLRSQKTGIGKLFGVGFYVDESKRLIDSETGENVQGYVAPYAVLRVQLIDLDSRKTVNETSVQTSELHAPPLSQESAWAAMTAAQKVQALHRVIRQAAGDAAPKVLRIP